MAQWLGDFKNHQGGAPSVWPQAASATVNGAFVDLLNAEGPVTMYGTVGDTAGSPTTFSVTYKLQEAIEDTSNLGNPLSSDWSDVSSGAASAVTAAEKEVILTSKYRAKRFVRVVATIAFTGGTSPTIGVAASVLANKKISGTGPGNQL